MTNAERFWANVQKTGSCWLWTAAKSEYGYGYCRVRWSKTRRAHRAAWELTNGPIPQGLCVCHRCDNPRCVRPDHLFLGTATENNYDRDAKGRGNPGAFHRSKTRCPSGHAYTPENTYIRPKGHRVCRACKAVHAKRRAERKSA